MSVEALSCFRGKRAKGDPCREFHSDAAEEVKDPKTILTEFLLTSISVAMSSVVAVDIEQENFMELGSFLHRTTPAVIELQSSQNGPPNAIEILQSVSTHVDLAKDLVRKCSAGAKSIVDIELKAIIEQLEGVIRNIGQDLSSIPSSTYENNGYAEIAIQSLSREMQNARFHVSGIQLCDMEEPMQENPSMEEIEGIEEKQSVQASKEESQINSSDTLSGDVPRLVDFLKGMYYGANNHDRQSFKTSTQLSEYLEPLCETFICPITKKIMDEPVTIESGVTYERRAISKWFESFKDGSESLVCPSTWMKLKSTAINTNIALKTKIAEWKERNEAPRIRVARTALSLASSKAMVLDGIRDLQLLCRKRSCKVQMHNIGVTKLLTRFLEHEDMKVRCQAMDLLCLLVEDEEGKVIIGKTRAIATTIKMLSSNHPSEKHSSASLLLELSKSELLCEDIGSVTGGILMLVTMIYNEAADPSAAEKARETLKNLEKFPKHIKSMADNGLLEPLLNHLIHGSEDMQMEMVRYLGELVLGHDMKTYVAERASATLIKMVQGGNILTRKAAFKALVQISSHRANCKTLVDAGAVPIMIEEIFSQKIYNKNMDSKEESATVISNLLEFGADPESLRANKHGHTMASDYVIYSIAHMLKYTIPDELNKNLIKILLSLSKLPKPLATIVSVLKETKVCYTVIEFLNSTQEELIIVSAKLLIILSSHMGHTIAAGLCKTKGQPESLIKNLKTDCVTNKHVVSVNLLAKLPHQNPTLNLALLNGGTIPTILQRIHGIQRGEARTSRHVGWYLVGLVGILVRFTTTLYEQEILCMALENNLASILTELLVRTVGGDEVQRLAAVGLENLSRESINLSRQPRIKKTKKTKFLSRFFIMGSPKDRRLKLCPVHRGECSPSTTFCLLEARAVERLLGCLEHENPRVVEAALLAICTLLDERVDMERSVEVLSDVNAVGHMLGVLREQREERVREKTFWVIERLLVKGKGRSVSDMSDFPSTLVSAFHHGDNSTRPVAERISRNLNRMPHFSRNLQVV